jgi:DNA processing protein
VQSAADIKYIMNWDLNVPSDSSGQRELFISFTPDEENLIAVLKKEGCCGIDLLCMETQLMPAKVASALLNLEFEGIVKCLPGKVFRLL